MSLSAQLAVPNALCSAVANQRPAFGVGTPSCRQARIVANPGCYPTSVQLPLVPLLAANLITAEDIIIDAKSGERPSCVLIKAGGL